MPYFSEETQRLLDRAQLAIDHAIELRDARIRATKDRKRFWDQIQVLSPHEHEIDPKDEGLDL